MATSLLADSSALLLFIGGQQRLRLGKSVSGYSASKRARMASAARVQLLVGDGAHQRSYGSRPGGFVAQGPTAATWRAQSASRPARKSAARR